MFDDADSKRAGIVLFRRRGRTLKLLSPRYAIFNTSNNECYFGRKKEVRNPVRPKFLKASSSQGLCKSRIICISSALVLSALPIASLKSRNSTSTKGALLTSNIRLQILQHVPSILNKLHIPTRGTNEQCHWQLYLNVYITEMTYREKSLYPLRIDLSSSLRRRAGPFGWFYLKSQHYARPLLNVWAGLSLVRTVIATNVNMGMPVQSNFVNARCLRYGVFCIPVKCSPENKH